MQPNADVSVAAQAAMQQRTDFLRCFAGDSRDANLPAGLIFYYFTIAQCQAAIFGDIADSANIDSTIGSILHNFSFPVFGIFLSLSEYIITHDTQKVKHNFPKIWT
jgi:hypothetical protein